MTGAERIYTIEVSIVRCPGDSGRDSTPTRVRYCDTCRRWGAADTTHLCGRTWRERLSDLLIELEREARQ